MNAALRAQQRYREDAILSAPPERLVTMLYDRLLLDIERAETAQRAADWAEANTQLQHAQAIVAELSSSSPTNGAAVPDCARCTCSCRRR